MRYFFGTAILLAFSSLPVSFAFQEKANATARSWLAFAQKPKGWASARHP